IEAADLDEDIAHESRSTSDLRPTIAEYQPLWWIDNNLYFQEFVPRAPPIKEHHGLFETYLSKLEKAHKRGKTGFMVSSIGGTTDNIVFAHERSDRQAKLKFTDEISSMTFDLRDSLNSMFAYLIEAADLDEDIAHLTVRCEERHEQILELKILVGSIVVAESVRLLQKFQQDDLESSRGMMRLIYETQLKVLQKLSFIALLHR
nr:phospholipase-like protein [Tanacetum cinerariifolium]